MQRLINSLSSITIRFVNEKCLFYMFVNYKNAIACKLGILGTPYNKTPLV